MLLALPPLLFSPWLFAMVRQYSRAGHGYEPDLGPGSLLSQVVTNYVLGDWTTIGGTFVLAVAIVALFGVLPAWPRAHDSRDSIDPEVLPRPERHGLILLTAAFAAPVGAYLLTLLTGIDLRATGRMYYLPGVPPFLLLVGRGLVWLGDGLSRVLNQIRDEKRAEWAGFAARIPPIQHAFHPGFGSSLVAVAGFVGIVAGTTPYLTHQYVARLKQDFRGAAGYVQQHEWPGDAVILDAEYIFRPFSYYYHGAAPWYRAVVEPGAAEAALAKETSGRERVWLVLSHDGFADPDHRVQTWLDQHGVELDEAWFEGVHLRLYAMDHHPMLTRPDVGHPVDLRFGSQVSLVGTDLPSRASGGSDLHLRLVWHDLAPIDEDLHATLLLTGSDGRVWWQTDHAPISPYYLPTRWQPGEYLIDRYDLPLPLGLPPGPYQLVVKLYSPRTGQALAVAGQPTATLGTLQVGATHLDALRSGTDVAPGLRLIDASLDRAQARPGDDVTALLTWEATSAAPGLVSVSLVGPSGVAAATVADPFARGTTVGAVLRVPIALHLPARAVPGAYRVQVGSNDPNAGALQVRPISRSFAPPAVEYPQTATLSQPNGSPLVGLDGYDLSATSLAPGATFRLTLYWQARGEGSTDYTVFTHLIGPDGQIHAQKDSAPDAGQRPTSGWLKGEVVRDPYDLSLDPKAPPGEYYLEVGMYRPDTGARLMDGDNSAIILKERIRVGQAR